MKEDAKRCLVGRVCEDVEGLSQSSRLKREVGRVEYETRLAVGVSMCGSRRPMTRTTGDMI